MRTVKIHFGLARVVPYPDNGGGPDAGGLNRMDKNNNTFTRFIHDP
jgi:hypothetical protein